MVDSSETHIKSSFLFIAVLVLLLIGACASPKKEKQVVLESLHEYYHVLAEEIPEDIFTLCSEEKSLRQMLNKSYITPKMHSSIVGAWGPYSGVCNRITALGINDYNLAKIVETDLVYKFVYTLNGNVTSEKMTLELFLNKSYGLSEFHIYKMRENGVENILFPDKNTTREP